MISWLHSKLQQKEDGEVILLAVGLDITERTEAEHKLAWAANHDPLTETLNRRGFQTYMLEQLVQHEQQQLCGGLMLLDLDNFKLINDTGGHLAGDRMLKQVAQLLNRLVADKGKISRLGGDEFAVLLPGASREAMLVLAEKIYDQIGQLSWKTPEQLQHTSCSIGIVLYPEHGASSQDLMAHADLAMYKAKHSGHHKWQIYRPDDNALEIMTSAHQWKKRIEAALKNERFVLHFQPILEVVSNRISHYEVLIRMRGDDGALIPPGLFIPAAEASGQIQQIDRLVLTMALKQLAQLQQQGRDITLAVNLSGRVVNEPELPELIRHQLHSSNIDPARLIFEITETAALGDIVAASNLVDEIRALGCKFALDDFGVGFSSFFYLKQLAVDYVKLDGAFIKDLAINPDDQIFTKALVEVARGMGKKTIAEFVESQQTLELLKRFGVDYAQGYFIGQPKPEFVS